jgi:hypothetical protein
MSNHLITGTITYVVLQCGSCFHIWEQANTPLDEPGWVVCPECLFAAPAEVRESVAAR